MYYGMPTTTYVFIIKDLSYNKSPGLDGIYGEHMKFAGQQLPALLFILMSAILVHGYVPKSMKNSVIFPIIKNKNKRINDKDNYRPICLANVFTKVVEKVLYSRIDGYMQSTFNQFGFKRKHGTEFFFSKRTYKILHKTLFLYVCGFSRCIQSF